MVHGLVAKAASTLVTGVVGAAAYEAVRRAAAELPVHDAAVTATAWGLRGTRKAEETAESARLRFADVLAEARERIGEEVPPPTVSDVPHDHEH